MAQNIKELALDYIDSERECNFYAANHNLTLRVYNQDVDVESIWRSEDKVYLHCGCKEFEADIDIESLSEENQKRVCEVLKGDVITPSMVPTLMKAFEGKPLVFLFRVADVQREELDDGLSREECFNRCINYYELDGLDCAWNDTDDDEQCLPEVKNTWCYVSMSEQNKEPWEFDEQAFIELYCPMEGGNDYLGWIDDIYKLLHGEAEPGDAASTGDYANMSEEELRAELKRLTAIMLHQAVDRYVGQNY